MTTSIHGNTTIDSINAESVGSSNATLFGAIRAANICLFYAFIAFSKAQRRTKSVAAVPAYLMKDRVAPAGCITVDESPWQRWVEAWRVLADVVVTSAFATGSTDLLTYLSTFEQTAEAVGKPRKVDPVKAAAIVDAVPERFRKAAVKGAETSLNTAAQRNAEDAGAALAEIEAYAAAIDDCRIDLREHELAKIVQAFVDGTMNSMEGSIGRGFYHKLDGTVREDKLSELLLTEQAIETAELELEQLNRDQES